MEPGEFSNHSPSFNVNNSNDHVIANDCEETAVAVKCNRHGSRWQYHGVFQFRSLEIEELEFNQVKIRRHHCN